MQFPKLENDHVHYKLVATVEHTGSLQGGHYWARCFRHGKYFMCNDTNVSQIENLEPTVNTYMLFYHLI